jgi:type III secretion protein N (ATPase)
VIERAGRPDLWTEAIGFVDDDVLLMPLGDANGIGPDDLVRYEAAELTVRCSEALLGRVLDGLGRPLDGGPPVEGEDWPVSRSAPAPLTRPRIERPLELGVRVLDALVTVGEGQRIGIFAGSGVGKSSLLGQIARQAEADVFVVCLVGERGRELVELLEDSLGEDGRARGVVVCATSDTPALVRLKSAHVATAIAEWFRAQGKRVVLLMDSLTRFARAGREVGLAAGEPPARRGFPPSAFAALPVLLERAGNDIHGSITAFYTVLVEGGDMEEPIADEVRGILDGHVVLTRDLTTRGRWPAVDVLASLSRAMDGIVDPAHAAAARRLREVLGHYEEKRDLVLLGAYRPGSDARLDDALTRIDAIEAFLRQARDERSAFDATVRALQGIVG